MIQAQSNTVFMHTLTDWGYPFGLCTMSRHSMPVQVLCTSLPPLDPQDYRRSAAKQMISRAQPHILHRTYLKPAFRGLRIPCFIYGHYLRLDRRT